MRSAASSANEMEAAAEVILEFLQSDGACSPRERALRTELNSSFNAKTPAPRSEPVDLAARGAC